MDLDLSEKEIALIKEVMEKVAFPWDTLRQARTLQEKLEKWRPSPSPTK